MIALLAEDETDCDTIRKIIHRVLGDETPTKPWSSKGCGFLKRKLSGKLKEMSKKGCNAFIILHDLDRNPSNNSLNDERALRAILTKKSSGITQPKHICIPIEEIEAWFWADPGVVQYVGNGKGHAPPNPHSIIKPKERLMRLSTGENRKPRYSQNMNAELAEKLNLEVCAQRCPSFKDLLDFLHSL